MNSITHAKRYLPHELTTRIHAVNLYRSTGKIDLVCRKYKVSKASLMRWNRRYDGSQESLMDHSHRPLTPHPNAHTDEELRWILNLCRRNKGLSLLELYGKLRKRGYKRHPLSLYRVFIRLGLRTKLPSTKKKSLHLQHYDTPKAFGIKWQMDVKYIPSVCYTGSVPQKFYQYTMIEEASRERFIYAYEEQSSASTCDFIARAIKFFGYLPKQIQTDNGAEFTHFCKTDRIHPMDALCDKLGIEHKCIRPRTPWHNGKVERSHRNDQERFYNLLTFATLEEVQQKMHRYLMRSNAIPSKAVGWMSPQEKRRELFEKEPPQKATPLPDDIMKFIYENAS